MYLISAERYIYICRSLLFNTIQDGGGGGGRAQKALPLTSFSSVTSTNVGISLKTFLTFSLNPFARLV